MSIWHFDHITYGNPEFLQKEPRLGHSSRKKHVLFTGHIEDNVKIFRFVDAH